MALPPLNPQLGRQVTSRNFSLLEMVERAWGSEWAAPDHGVYQFSGGRRFDSTDMGTTGIYRRGVTPAPYQPPSGGPWTADSGVTADSGIYTADGGGPVSPQEFTADSTITADSGAYTADAGGPIPPTPPPTPGWKADSTSPTIDTTGSTIDE
jgi:hypothetical protein